MENSIAHNLESILQTLPPQVTLVAVSKTKPAALVQEAYEAGQRDFGENYVQELVDKQQALPSDIRWHFIGHLQSNKVKFIAPFIYLIHGVDSFKLLQEIDRQGKKNGRVIDCLLQIHIAAEETKFGFSFAECEDMMNEPAFAELKNVKIRGMMAMASNTDDQDQIRAEFAGLKRFFDTMSNNVLEMDILSAGMSGDYQIAIEQGSTMIRIGSSIFGSRR
jgi:pyridoxal phosphate enzyme (YggS family)